MTIRLELPDPDVLRAEWLAARRRGIGASESAALVGASPWASPLSVWAAKVLPEPEERPEDEREAMQWGTLLEPVVLEEYARRRGIHVRRHDQTRSLDHPRFEQTRMTATPDAYDRDGGVIDAKTTSAYLAGDWADGAPVPYRIQIQHQMAVTGRDHGTLVCLIGGQRLVWHDEPRNPEFIDALEEICGRFWREYVEPKAMPPADFAPGGSLAATVRALERLHPDDSGETVILAPEAAEWDARLAEIQEQLRPLEAEKKDLQDRLRAALGPATFGEILGVPGRWSWKTQERDEHVVKASKFRVLRKLKK